MKVGFTGTRHGMTEAQVVSLNEWFDSVDPTKFHHGACKGADAEAVTCARNFTMARIVAHPGKSAKGGDNEWLDQDALALSDEVHEIKTHFARNRDIVDECDLIVGCPGVDTWQSHGGTFYTLDYALKKRKSVKVIWPDGRVEDK